MDVFVSMHFIVMTLTMKLTLKYYNNEIKIWILNRHAPKLVKIKCFINNKLIIKL